MTQKIVAWMIHHQVISKEDEELYCYGIFNLIFDFVPTVIIITLSIVLHSFWETICIMISMRSIRKYSGGYHLSNPYSCCIFSVLLLTSAGLAGRLTEDTTYGIVLLIIIGIFCMIPLFVCSPIKSCYINLDYEEIIKYRRKTRQILFLHAVLIMICYFFRVSQIVVGLSIGLIIAGELQIIQYLVNKKSSKR